MNLFKKLFSKSVNIKPPDKELVVSYYDVWDGKNEIENVREDGFIIYKTNRVTNLERKQVGFYGKKMFSDNCKYCVVWLNDNDEKYNISLVDCIAKIILFKGKLDRPHQCVVNDEGFVCCEDLGKFGAKLYSIILFDVSGKELSRNKHKWPLHSNLFIDNNRQVIYTTNDFKKHTIKF